MQIQPKIGSKSPDLEKRVFWGNLKAMRKAKHDLRTEYFPGMTPEPFLNANRAEQLKQDVEGGDITDSEGAKYNSRGEKIAEAPETDSDILAVLKKIDEMDEHRGKSKRDKYKLAEIQASIEKDNRARRENLIEEGRKLDERKQLQKLKDEINRKS